MAKELPQQTPAIAGEDLAFEAGAKVRIPLQRGGQPHEMVGAALYLASAGSSYTTGAIIAVDSRDLKWRPRAGTAPHRSARHSDPPRVGWWIVPGGRSYRAPRSPRNLGGRRHKSRSRPRAHTSGQLIIPSFSNHPLAKPEAFIL